MTNKRLFRAGDVVAVKSLKSLNGFETTVLTAQGDDIWVDIRAPQGFLDRQLLVLANYLTLVRAVDEPEPPPTNLEYCLNCGVVRMYNARERDKHDLKALKCAVCHAEPWFEVVTR